MVTRDDEINSRSDRDSRPHLQTRRRHPPSPLNMGMGRIVVEMCHRLRIASLMRADRPQARGRTIPGPFTCHHTGAT